MRRCRSEANLFTGEIFSEERIPERRDRLDIVQLIVGEDIQRLIGILRNVNRR